MGASRLRVKSPVGLYVHLPVFTVKQGKGKSILLQTWTGPEGSRRLRLPDFKTIDS